MYSQSISKTVAVALIAIFAPLATANSQASAQEIFGGRGISGLVDGSGSSFSNPLGSQFETQSTNPIAGIFKKPAFLQNLQGFKIPSFTPGGNNQSSGSGFLAGLPKLSSLIPQSAPAELSMLGKLKAKTDAFFAKASILEKLIPGRQQTSSQGEPAWSAVRQSMEQIMAAQAAQPTSRTANATGSTTRR